MKTYQPPFTVTPTIIGLISDISESLGRLSVLEDEMSLRLRRINCVRTIQGSLAIKGNTTPQVTPHDTPQVKRLLLTLSAQLQPINSDELQTLLKLKDRKSFQERYLKPALDQGLIEMTLPDKPNSRLQKYTLTARGRLVAKLS